MLIRLVMARCLIFGVIIISITAILQGSRQEGDIARRMEILEDLLLLKTRAIQEEVALISNRQTNMEANIKENKVKISDVLDKFLQGKTDRQEPEYVKTKQRIDVMSRRVQTIVAGVQKEKSLNLRMRREINYFKDAVEDDLQALIQKVTDVKEMVDSVQGVLEEVDFLDMRTNMETVRREIDSLSDAVEDDQHAVANSLQNITDMQEIVDNVHYVLEQANLVTMGNKLETCARVTANIDNYMNNLTATVHASLQTTKAAESCSHYLARGYRGNGIYRVERRGLAVDVFCDMETENGGWTVFQRRQDGSEDFFRTWNDYKIGFGQLFREFWLGNDNLHLLTAGLSQELRIDMESREGDVFFAKYSSFLVNSEINNYTLEVSGFGGNISYDSFGPHSGYAFATSDRDTKGGCARQKDGAWWYHSCYYSNLNGEYSDTSDDGIVWYTRENGKWKAIRMKKTEMKFRTE